MQKIKFLLLFMCISTATMAQENTVIVSENAEENASKQSDLEGKDNKLRFGVKVGINFSTFYGNTNYLSQGLAVLDLKYGFTGGVVAEYKLGRRFVLQPEVLFANVGTRFWYHDHPYEDGLPKKYSLYYINVPVLVKYEFLENLFVELGPEIGFLLKGNKEYGEEGVTITENITSELNKLDYGASFGVEMWMTKHFFMDADYTIGLTNVFEDSTNGVTKNNVVTLSMGYMF